MEFTDKESEYLDYLTRRLSVEEMAVELDMIVKEVDDFGTALFDRLLEERSRGIM